MDSVRSALRTLQIFEAFRAAGRPLLLTEVAPMIGVPASSCYGLLQTLLNQGYLFALNRRRGFYPTRKLQMLGNAIAAKDVYLQRLQPHLAALREATAETVIVGTRQNHQVLYLDVLEGPQTIRYSAMPGDFKPLHSSAIGKALLSLEPSIVAALSHQGWLPSVTPATITRPEDLLADLRVGQARGYFMTSGENVADVTALAVPVRVDGMALGVAVAGPSHRMAPAIPRVAAALLAAAAHIQGARI